MKIKVIAIVSFILLLLTTGFPQQVTYQDVASIYGLVHPSQPIKGGISFCDFNDDGLDDISFNSSNGFPLYIFKNDITHFTAVTDQLGIDDSLYSTHLLWVDFDNDNDKDLFIGHYGSKNTLFRNDGNNQFTDITSSAGLNSENATTFAACWGDYNNDGWIDLYITNYSEFQPNYLYKNNGDDSFTDVTTAANVADTVDNTNFYKNPWTAAFFDFNNDGLLDIYTVNDHFTGNSLFKNLGDGTFEDISSSSGTEIKGFLMGLSIGDYDNNGFLDIYLSNDPFGNYLLKNNGDETFTDVTSEAGVAVNKVCWGASFFDYDNDADLDLYVSVAIGTTNYNNVLFENQSNGTFTQITEIGLDGNYDSYGNSIGDFDNNGYCDIAVFNQNSNMNLYKSSGGSNNWIKIKLNGYESNNDGIGSFIEVYFDDTRIVRFTQCGDSYSSQSGSTLTIGIGDAIIIDSLKVSWPSGIVDIFYIITPNQTLNIEEGETVVPVELSSFTAKANNNEVVLNWSTATETNNQGFDIERKSNGQFEKVGYVGGFGTTAEVKAYTFTDKTVGSGNYTYRLKQVDFNGTFEYSPEVEVEVSAPKVYQLSQNYPNPFNPATTINFSLAADSKVSLKIFDVIGQEVAQLVNGQLAAGQHNVNFDASSLNSGVYFYKIEANGVDGTSYSSVKKMILTK